MSIQLGNYTFGEHTAAAAEKRDEVGGRERRIITIKGFVEGLASVEAIEAELDAILAAASDGNPATPLSLRESRRMLVRREAFDRQINRAELLGAFSLALKADNPLEESEEVMEENWSVTQSGAEIELETAGNHPAFPVITIEATGNLQNPAISDGENTLRYNGVVASGETLVLDGVNQRVLLEGANRTWQSEGAFPRIAPGGTTFTYTDALVSAHTADITVAWRDTWY